MKSRSIIIVGAGEFGLTAALELHRRGWQVTLLDAGSIPRDLAASTDISKVVRMDYGTDEQHTALGEAAIAGWHLWNARWGEPLYHEDGFLVLAGNAMLPGSFEHESFQFLSARGHSLQRLDARRIQSIYPAWNTARHADGYLNPRAGWVESGRVIARLVAEAKQAGIVVRENTPCASLLENGSTVQGVQTAAGESLRADLVLVAAGAWTPQLLPHLAPVMWASGQTVLHFRVDSPAQWQPPHFPVWAAEIGRTGWYGFPALPNGILKVANHGRGRRQSPDASRDVLEIEIARFRNFLRDSLPALAEAPLAGSRLCFYCDTFDGNFWITHDRHHRGLVVAAGDSGHAFKFAPVLGGLIADVVEQKPNRLNERYTWREPGNERADSARAR